MTFFLLSPAMLGALLGCDSMNQTYSSTWGLFALYIFLSAEGAKKYWWLLFALFATFSKENGLAWFIVPPLLAFGFNRFDKKKYIQYSVAGVLCVVVYFIMRVLLTVHDSALSALGDESSPYAFSIKKKIVDIGSFLASTFTAIDPIAIIPENCRNILVASLSLLASLPFVWVLMRCTAKVRDERKSILCFTLCILICAAPHLATHFGPMHAYASLGIVALLIGKLIQSTAVNEKLLKGSFALFIVTSLLVDTHHYYWMLKSSKLFIPVSQNVIKVLDGKKPKSIYFISRYTFKRYSAFVIPYEDMFVHGYALRFYNRYDWPLRNTGETIVNPTQECLDSITKEKSKHYDAVIYTDKAEARLLYLNKNCHE